MKKIIMNTMLIFALLTGVAMANDVAGTQNKDNSICNKEKVQYEQDTNTNACDNTTCDKNKSITVQIEETVIEPIEKSIIEPIEKSVVEPIEKSAEASNQMPDINKKTKKRLFSKKEWQKNVEYKKLLEEATVDINE